MTDDDNKTPIEEAKWQVENLCCEGSHHNHDLIVGLLAEIERLQAYRTAADAYLECLNDHLHGENLRCDLVTLRANWEAARAAP